MTTGKQASRRRAGQAGQSILELAIVLPILAILLAIVVDAARAFDAYIVLTNAVREGARYGSLDSTLAVEEVQTLVVADVLGSGTNITHMTDFNTANVAVAGIGVSTAVTVTARYDFDLWFGGLIGLDTFHLEKQAVMPVY